MYLALESAHKILLQGAHNIHKNVKKAAIDDPLDSAIKGTLEDGPKGAFEVALRSSLQVTLYYTLVCISVIYAIINTQMCIGQAFKCIFFLFLFFYGLFISFITLFLKRMVC